ncbi:sensor histidine kinase [Aquibacillus sediminis]|uniref:sensor histidine kinase n=1 Tax=Aquibacillus sediminis TaxID=2574734 RepID=UPI001107D572|nr:sensor histidine kinase [Aquibacillus sediminis]
MTKNNDYDQKTLDYIIDEMVETVQNSKDEVFSISEDSRKEYEQLQHELEQIKHQIVEVIDAGDELERKTRLSRNRLSEVNKDFRNHSEEQIREVYEQTHQLQTELTMKREKEKNLQEKRNELERRLKSIEQTVERADGLVGKISVVLNYLKDDFQQVTEIIQDAQLKQQFGLQIIEAQEEERQRLAREMHDGPAQVLANILIRSEIVDKTFRERSVEETLTEIKSVKQMVRGSLQQVRRIIYDLRPMVLDDLGLVPAIKKYLDTASETSNASIRFTPISKEKRLDSKYEVALYRLVQESVQNAIKHASPTKVDVKLEITNARVQILIKDNGSGFDVNETKANSFGIVGMKERVDMLDGDLTIDSIPGSGTRVMIVVPINQN